MRGEDQRIGRHSRPASGNERGVRIDPRGGERLRDLMAAAKRAVLVVKLRERQVARPWNVAGGDARPRIRLAAFKPRAASSVEQAGVDSGSDLGNSDHLAQALDRIEA